MKPVKVGPPAALPLLVRQTIVTRDEHGALQRRPEAAVSGRTIESEVQL
jgi:hypothetical protein